MIKLTIRRARLFVLAAILVGSIFGSFHNSITMADDGGEGGPVIFYNGYEEGGGGTVTCPDSGTCGNFGCHPRSIADPTQVCSRYKLQANGPDCPSPVNCS